MQLIPREPEKLCVYQVAEPARRRREHGTERNITETPARTSEAIRQAARRGTSVAECLERGKLVVAEADGTLGVRERLPLLPVEATVVDGSKLVSCHDPVAA